MAAATARQIPVVNNVITDEDFENLRTEGKVSTFLMQSRSPVEKHCEITCYLPQHSGKLLPVSVLKTHKLLTDKHSVSPRRLFIIIRVARILYLGCSRL